MTRYTVLVPWLLMDQTTSVPADGVIVGWVGEGTTLLTLAS